MTRIISAFATVAIIALLLQACSGGLSLTATGGPYPTNTGTTTPTATSTALRFEPSEINAVCGETVNFAVLGGAKPYPQFGFVSAADIQSYQTGENPQGALDQTTGGGWYMVGTHSPAVDRLCVIDSAGGQAFLTINVGTGTGTGTVTGSGTGTSTGTGTGTGTSTGTGTGTSTGSGTGTETTVKCYPKNETFWTGNFIYRQTAKNDDMIKFYYADCEPTQISYGNWIKIDLSAIPQGATVTKAVLYFNASAVRRELEYNLGLWINQTSSDPVTATVAQISDNADTSVIVTKTFKIPIATVGWYSAEFKDDKDGIGRLNNALSTGWFAMVIGSGGG
jgi:hypothetical protein